ncbi:MAG: Phosphoribosyl pyrophosphate synthase [Patescibacteria group bacterium]|nr:Phosphoribosyl pyrophosphate synthase [Patescibacteria group bacterium]
MTNSNEQSLNPYPFKLFGSPSGTNLFLAEEVAKQLNTILEGVSYKDFSDGSFIAHHTESIRDCDVYLILQPRFGNKEILSYDLDECESMVYALKQGEPNRITVIVPCLPYARQDKSSNYREPILVQKVPMRLQMAGADKLVVLKLHNPSSYNAHPLTIPIVNIETSNLLINQIKSKGFNLEEFKIVAPDLGAAPFCRKLAQALGIPSNIVIINKFRDPKSANQSEVMEVIGDANNFHCIIPDDLADTCGTAVKTFKALKDRGAKDIYFTAIHGVLTGKAVENLNSADFKEVWFSDTCDFTEKEKLIKNLQIMPTANLIAKVIDNLHNGKSITDLSKNGDN